MSRRQATTEDKMEFGGPIVLFPKDEYLTFKVVGFEDKEGTSEKTGKPYSFIEFKFECVTEGDYFEAKHKGSFSRNVGDDRSEDNMVNFLKFLAPNDAVINAVTAKTPNGTSWVDEETINVIKLETLGKAIGIKSYHKKYQDKMYNEVAGYTYASANGSEPAGAPDAGPDIAV